MHNFSVNEAPSNGAQNGSSALPISNFKHNLMSYPFQGWGEGCVGQFPTFVPEFKFAKIPKSHFRGGGGGRPLPNFDVES